MSSASPGRKSPTPGPGEEALAGAILPASGAAHPGYELIEPLHEGGQATPWKATDRGTGQTVCVTLLRWSNDLDADAWARLCEKFRDARDAYRQLHAARITPRVIDFVEPGLPTVRPSGGAYFRPYMVIEFFPHGDVGRALFRVSPANLQQAIAPWLLRRGIELLGKLHHAERAHGDATLENMLAYPAEDGSVAFVAADLLNSHHGTGLTRPGAVWKPGVWVPNEAWRYYRGEWPDAPLSKRCAWDIAVFAASMRRWLTCRDLPNTEGGPGEHDIHILGDELWSLLEQMQAGFESADSALRHIDKVKEGWTGPWATTWAIDDFAQAVASGKVRRASSGNSGGARETAVPAHGGFKAPALNESGIPVVENASAAIGGKATVVPKEPVNPNAPRPPAPPPKEPAISPARNKPQKSAATARGAGRWIAAVIIVGGVAAVGGGLAADHYGTAMAHQAYDECLSPPGNKLRCDRWRPTQLTKDPSLARWIRSLAERARMGTRIAPFSREAAFYRGFFGRQLCALREPGLLATEQQAALQSAATCRDALADLERAAGGALVAEALESITYLHEVLNVDADIGAGRAASSNPKWREWAEKWLHFAEGRSAMAEGRAARSLARALALAGESERSAAMFKKSSEAFARVVAQGSGAEVGEAKEKLDRNAYGLALSLCAGNTPVKREVQPGGASDMAHVSNSDPVDLVWLGCARRATGDSSHALDAWRSAMDKLRRTPSRRVGPGGMLGADSGCSLSLYAAALLPSAITETVLGGGAPSADLLCTPESMRAAR